VGQGNVQKDRVVVGDGRLVEGVLAVRGDIDGVRLLAQTF